jgi:arylsulfatase
MSVLLVLLDAARADHFGAYGYERATTPAIDAFAADALRYETVIAEAPFTFLATASLFTAGSPAVTGLVGRSGGRIPASLSLITEAARESGFATVGYSENPYITEYFGFHRGFDVFEEAFPVSLHLKRGQLADDFDSGARLDAILDQAVSDPSRPFFLYAHLLRPHAPYAPPAPFAGRFGSKREQRALGESRALEALDARGPPFDPMTLEALVALYDENLAYSDALFARLLSGLEARGRLDRTIVILTSDHGEAFGEQGRLLHSTQLHDPMLRIPLVVRVPGARSGVESRPVQLADLGRALETYFADPVEGSAFRRLGHDRVEDAPLYSWTNAKTHLVAARTPTRKLVIDAATRRIVAYYDLMADRNEQRSIPLDPAGRALAPLLQAKIDQWVGLPVRIETDPELDPEKRRQLEALGYLEPEEKD